MMHATEQQIHSPEGGAFEGTSREFQLICDARGGVLWLDDRARVVLAIEVGANLVDSAAPGSAEKVRRLLSATSAPTEPWEVALCIEGQPRTLQFRKRPGQGGSVALTGSLVPEDFGAVLAQVGASLAEVAALHRETDRQQRELLRRREELVRLHRELEESHRGVVALHAEIGERDDSIRRANEVKARLVANVSHEFRTPLNSILGLTKLLMSRSDGDLTDEQDTQLSFIKQSAESLYALVNDLLDLSKMEAGKSTLRTEKFDVSNFFSTFRGMLRPLLVDSSVELVFDEPPEPLELETDEGKVAQIIRNLVSNAVKFTPSGEIRVSAVAQGKDAVFLVKDTGIGLEPADQERIFDEFYQVDGELQRQVKGTGLGLPIARNLAERLGGTLDVQSEAGHGSTFVLRIPTKHPEARELSAMQERSQRIAPEHQPVLVVEDDRQTLFLYEKYLRGSGFQVIPARSIDEARLALKRIKPAAVVLDIMLDGETSWSFLEDIKKDPNTRDIPALVVTVTSREETARALGADEFFMKPMDREWLLTKLKALARTHAVETVLVIDDDRVGRYLVRKHLEGSPFNVIEASDGIEGLRLARERQPQVIFLDLVMPEMSAFDVLDELKKDPSTRGIPVIIHTSKNLAEEERRRLEKEATSVLSKQSLSRELAIGRIREALEKVTTRSARQEAGRV